MDLQIHPIQFILNLSHQSSLPMITSRWLLKIFNEGDSTSCLGNWIQCSIT